MLATNSKARRGSHAGVTLLEVLIAAAVMAMMATMIYQGFEQTSRIGRRLSGRQEHDHFARQAINMLMNDVRSAFLSAHVNTNPVYLQVVTGFVARHEQTGDRLDLTTFTHRRMVRGSHEGDACEVGYRVEQRRGASGAFDLLRREAPRIDSDPMRGGTVDVLVPDIVSFTLKYFDPEITQWIDTWDTMQAAGQLGRLPSRVRVALVMRDSDGTERRYMSETSPMITNVLRFGLPLDYP